MNIGGILKSKVIRRLNASPSEANNFVQQTHEILQLQRTHVMYGLQSRTQTVTSLVRANYFRVTLLYWGEVRQFISVLTRFKITLNKLRFTNCRRLVGSVWISDAKIAFVLSQTIIYLFATLFDLLTFIHLPYDCNYDSLSVTFAVINILPRWLQFCAST